MIEEDINELFFSIVLTGHLVKKKTLIKLLTLLYDVTFEEDYSVTEVNGNTIFTLKFHTPNSHGANVYKFEGDKLNKFVINFSGFYNLKSYHVTKNRNNQLKILINLIKYESIQKENTWTNNKDKFCSKFIVISP